MGKNRSAQGLHQGNCAAVENGTRHRAIFFAKGRVPFCARGIALVAGGARGFTNTLGVGVMPQREA